MRQTIRPYALAVLLAVVLVPTLGAAITFLSDDGGRHAPICSFIGSSGAPTFCSSADPLPVQGGAPTQTTTDPSGWGKTLIPQPQSILGSGATIPTNSVAGPVFITDTTLAMVTGDFGANIIDTWQSSDKGRTWTSIGINLPLVQGGPRVLLNTGTSFIMTHAGGVGAARSVTATLGYVPVTVAGGPIDEMAGIAQQGSTIIASANRLGALRICRSVNDGVNFTCIAPAAPLAVATSSEKQSIASPAPGIWVAIGTAAGVNMDQIYRSTDDGATWTQVQIIAGTTANTARAIVCSSSVNCIAAVDFQLWRSADAGATWSQVFVNSTAPATAEFKSLVSFGAGIVLAVPDLGAAPAANQFAVRTGDHGITWNATGRIDGTGGGACPVTAVGSTYQPAVNGLGDASLMGPCGASTIMPYISTTVGAGETIIAGANGNRLNINANGALGAYQDDGSSSQRVPWRSVPVQGSNILSAAPVTSAANAPAVLTVTGAANQRVCLRDLAVFSSAAGAATLTISRSAGPVVLYNLGTVTTGLQAVHFPFEALCVPSGENLVVNIGAAGVGVTTTTSAIADRQ